MKKKAQLLTHLCDKVFPETHFPVVHPAVDAGHLLPLVAATGSPTGAVRVLEQLAATRGAVLVDGADQSFPCEVAHLPRPAVVPFRDQREKHGAGEVERDHEVQEPAPHNHLFGVAAKAADAREEFGLEIHLGQRQRFVGTAGSAGLRGESDSLFGAGRLHLQLLDVPHQSREEKMCDIPSPEECCEGKGITSSLKPATIELE